MSTKIQIIFQGSKVLYKRTTTRHGTTPYHSNQGYGVTIWLGKGRDEKGRFRKAQQR